MILPGIVHETVHKIRFLFRPKRQIIPHSTHDRWSWGRGAQRGGGGHTGLGDEMDLAPVLQVRDPRPHGFVRHQDFSWKKNAAGWIRSSNRGPLGGGRGGGSSRLLAEKKAPRQLLSRSPTTPPPAVAKVFATLSGVPSTVNISLSCVVRRLIGIRRYRDTLSKPCYRGSREIWGWKLIWNFE